MDELPLTEEGLIRAHARPEHPEGVARLLKALLPIVPAAWRRHPDELVQGLAMEFCPVKAGCMTKTPGGRLCSFHDRSRPRHPAMPEDLL